MDKSEEVKPKEKTPLHILIGISGSVAAIKLPQLIFELNKAFRNSGKIDYDVQIRVIVTSRGLYFLEKSEFYEGSKDLYERFKNICIPYRLCRQRKAQNGDISQVSTGIGTSEEIGENRKQGKERNTSNTSDERRNIDLDFEDINEVILYEDDEEWESWTSLGDEVLHIALRNWADVFLLAPLSANTLAKLANGLCDNLLTSVARAWETKEKAKPFLIAPAMNTAMWEHPMTYHQINSLLERNMFKCIKSKVDEKLMHKDLLNEVYVDRDSESGQPPKKKTKLIEDKQRYIWKNEFKMICPIKKLLACGDFGIGAMASIDDIVSCVKVVVAGKDYPHYYIIEEHDIIESKFTKSLAAGTSEMHQKIVDINGETSFHKGQIIARDYR